MKKNIFSFLLVGLLIFSINLAGQTNFPDINPKWDNYYNTNPSGIERNYQASDFIRIMNSVGFVSIKYNQSKLETAFLRLEQAVLRQMRIDGNYFSRTYKHDDWFLLYNKYYKKISKDTWDRYCPYLIPLMSLDELITTH